jgi:hypothetical protein
MKDLIQFKKDKVEDPDQKKLRNAPRILPMNLKLQDNNGIEFGCKCTNCLNHLDCSVYEIRLESIPDSEELPLQSLEHNDWPRLLQAIWF